MEVIYSYSRQRAIDDGFLIDVTEPAREMGFRFPVAVTRSVWDTVLVPSPADVTQDTSGRLWDCLWMLWLEIKRGGKGSEVFFSFTVNDEGREKLIHLKAFCHPGDNMEPVITVMLPDED